jgi:signal peptidase I
MSFSLYIINLIGTQSVMFEPNSQPVISAVPPSAEVTASSGAFWSLLLQEIVQVVLPALILALVVHLYLAQATVVYGQSMEPNLSARQRLIVDKISYRLRAPQRDDIVVLNVPDINDLLVKRIVGLPGEVIEIRDGMVLVNGETLPEPFPHGTMPQNMAPITLAPLQYFVMGDNRNNSNDSRSFGPITRNDILGRVWLRYWPLEQFTFFQH